MNVDRRDEPGLDKLIRRIEEIVKQLDSDSVGLEDALALFEEGVGHLGRARKILDQTELRIEKLIGPDEGAVGRIAQPIARPNSPDDDLPF